MIFFSNNPNHIFHIFCLRTIALIFQLAAYDFLPASLVAYIIFSLIEHVIIISSVCFARSGLYRYHFKNMKITSKMLLLGCVFYIVYMICYIVFAVQYQGVASVITIIVLIYGCGIYLVLKITNGVLTKKIKRLEEIHRMKMERAQGFGFQQAPGLPN